jgi:hypothetical protein
MTAELLGPAPKDIEVCLAGNQGRQCRGKNHSEERPTPGATVPLPAIEPAIHSVDRRQWRCKIPTSPSGGVLESAPSAWHIAQRLWPEKSPRGHILTFSGDSEKTVLYQGIRAQLRNTRIAMSSCVVPIWRSMGS